MKQFLDRSALGRFISGIGRAFCGGAAKPGRDCAEPLPEDARNGSGIGSSCGSVPHPDLEIVVRTVKGAAARGNFHLLFSRDRQVGVILGDVAVAESTDTRTTEEVRQSAMSLLEVGSVERLFSELVHHLPRQRGHRFIRLLAVIAEPDREEIHIYNAGHAPVLLLTGDEREYAVATAPPVGMVEGAGVTPRTYAFQAYDTLFICSDGFFKVRAPDSAILTLNELEPMIHRAASDTLSEWADGIIAAARSFGAVRSDLTLVVMRMRPEKSRVGFRSRLPNRTSDS